MKTADLITSFLSNEMTPEQERQFLLSVAASDSLRLSLKSHVMLDRISAGQLNRAQVPVGVREAIFAQMGASMAEAPPVQTPAPAPGGMGRFTGSFLHRYGNRAMALLLTAGGFAAGYFANLDGDAPAARQAVTAQTVQTAPAVTREQPALSLRTGAQLPAASASRTEAAPAGASENLALREQSAQTSEVARPATTPARQDNPGRSVRSTQIRQHRTVVSSEPPSNPLEPASGLKTSEAPNAASNPSTVAAGMNVEDSVNAVKPIPNQPVSVQTSIKKSSSNTTPVQEQQED